MTLESLEPYDVLLQTAQRYDAHDLGIEESMINLVGLIDERFVVKVPKTRANIGGLAVEAAALELLENSQPLTVAVPRMVEFSADPTFLVTTYLPGNVVDATELRKLTTKERDLLGHDIGAYAAAQAVCVDLDSARRLPPLEQHDTWEALFEAGVGTFSSSAFPSLSLVSRQAYEAWMAYRMDDSGLQFTQGDLRLGNMAVSDTNRLEGVFDFGRAGIGDASYEVNPLANIDQTILRGAVDELNAHGITVEWEHIKLWDAMKDLLKLSYAVAGKASQNFISKALVKVPARYPELDWSELGQL